MGVSGFCGQPEGKDERRQITPYIAQERRNFPPLLFCVQEGKRHPGAESALDSTIGSVEQGVASVIKPGARVIGKILYGTPDLSNDLLISALEADADDLVARAQEDAQMASEGYGTVGQLISNAEIAGFQMLGDIMTGNPMASMMVRSFGDGAYP